MVQEREEVVKRSVILVDACVAAAAYGAAFVLRRSIGPEDLSRLAAPAARWIAVPDDMSVGAYLAFLAVAVPAWLVALQWAGAYRSMRARPYGALLRLLLKAALGVALILGTAFFLGQSLGMSRLFFALYMSLSVAGLLAERSAVFAGMRFVRRRGLNARRLLLVGTGPRAEAFVARLGRHPEWGFDVRGAIDDQPGRGVAAVAGIPVLGSLGDIPGILHRDAVDEVVFVVPRSRLAACEFALHDCETEGVPANVAVDLFDMRLARASLSDLDGLPLLRFNTTLAREGQLLVKRGMDLVLSGIGIVAASPLLLAAALAVKLTSPGPALFRQERLGLHGRRFVLYKFRTMKPGAQDELSRVESVSEMDTPEYRARKLSWVTPVGRLLRKTSIDELPQLFNVFLGQMSLIGPRPTVPDEVMKYETWQRRRFSMKPGITCLWQVMGRNKIGFEDWMRLDLEYLDRWSLWLDLKILVRTIPVVLFGTGAY